VQRRALLVRVGLELEAHPGLADVVLDPLMTLAEVPQRC
jgi:hypothetical protein